MISIVTTTKDFSPFPLRTSFNRSANTPSTVGNFQGSTLSPTTRASIEVIPNSAAPSLDLISRVREGLQYYTPELCQEGVNGTYFLKDKNAKKIAVFKPQDEEANSENNPKRNPEDTNLPNGILAGEAASREVAAFLLDREHFYGVPRTLMVKIAHSFNERAISSDKLITKIGSLQEFIDNDGSSEDFGPKSFPVSEVHKIGILDLQILNVDRHAGNILVQKSRNNSITLTPIDQGFSFPDTPECPWFEWMNWPQARVPFDEDSKSYIKRMDPERDIQMLKRQLGIRAECLIHMKFTVALLKKAVELNLTLYDVGTIICRKNPDLPSLYEEICKTAKNQIDVAINREEKNDLSNSTSEIESAASQSEPNVDDMFSDIVSRSLDHELDQIKRLKQPCKYPSSFVKRV